MKFQVWHRTCCVNCDFFSCFVFPAGDSDSSFKPSDDENNGKNSNGTDDEWNSDDYNSSDLEREERKKKKSKKITRKQLCPTCGVWVAQLEAHRWRIHTDEHKYSCSDCDFKTNSQFTLKGALHACIKL